MIASIGNSYTAGSFARSNVGGATVATFDNSTSGSSSAVGPTVYSPTLQSVAPASFTSDGDQPDFTSTTRQELRDWTNDQIKSGKMSFDDGSLLALMSGKVPVESPSIVDETLATEKVNFIDLIDKGISGAQSRGDQKAVSRLQKALTIISVRQKSSKEDDISSAESNVKLNEALEAFKKGALATPAQRARRDVQQTIV